MSKKKKDNISPEILELVNSYENMLIHGRKDYFDEDDLVDIADYYYNDIMRDNEALRCLDYALQLHPQGVAPRLMKAEIIFYHGDHKKAWEILDGISDKEDPDVLYYYGLFNLEEGNIERANDYYHKAYFKDSGDGGEMFSQLAWDFINHSEWDVLQEWFALLPDSLQHSVKVLEVKLECEVHADNIDKALAVAEELIDHDPYNVSYWTARARLNIEAGDMDKAWESVVYAIDIDKTDAEAYFLAGEIKYEEKLYDESYGYYKEGFKYDDKDGRAYFNAAMSARQIGKVDESQRMLDYAVKHMRDCPSLKPQIYLQYALNFIDKDDLKSAQKYLDMAKEAGISDACYSILEMRIHIRLGDSKAKIKDYVNDAIARCKEENSLYPPLIPALFESNDMEIVAYGIGRIEKMLPQYADSCVPYKALLYFYEDDRNKFLENLKLASESYPVLTKALFDDIFPKSLDVADYYDYAKEKIL